MESASNTADLTVDRSFPMESLRGHPPSQRCEHLNHLLLVVTSRTVSPRLDPRAANLAFHVTSHAMGYVSVTPEYDCGKTVPPITHNFTSCVVRGEFATYLMTRRTIKRLLPLFATLFSLRSLGFGKEEAPLFHPF